MTDSESDVTNSNVFTFQNVNTTVSARGPNTNITNFSFRNNQMTSSMYMPRNLERRYAESVSDQRSIYYRRETSPMSIHSACDIRPRNFQQYYNGMGSHQSVYNGRSGSPVSMRSIDSSASVSAADIAFAFKNVKFNKYDLRVIKEAYNKLMKQRFRKRIEKRRNMRMFLKGGRHKSGDDSGEQGSDSSISSDDYRSVKTSYKENMSCTESTRMNLTDFRKAVRENNILKDGMDNLKQSSFKNMFSINSSSRNNTFTSSTFAKPNQPVPTLKDRFKNGFVLPSQRFNKSVASSTIPENSERHQKNTEVHHRPNDINNCAETRQALNRNCESGSEEEIFSAVSMREKSTYNDEPTRKRSLDSDDDTSLPNKKKSKLSSPAKNSQTNKKVTSKTKKNSPVNNNDENSNNFEFAKPMLPVRKSKSNMQEKVIAKSKQPLTGFVEHIPSTVITNVEIEQQQPINTQDKPSDNQSQDDHLESSQNSDNSMRPSFIKRKLFTQKLDVAEKANLSSDAMNSPQTNVYSALQKEKNKARKLVTTQSCLNREVQEDNNLLDLIHKIVPPDRINITNQTSINQTKTDANNSNKKDDDDKWDVTSVISMCNENDVSDTFTDEEIFESNNTNKDTKKSKKESTNAIPKATTSKKTKHNEEESHEQPRECRIVVENMNYNQTKLKQTENQSTNVGTTNVAKSSAKTFWDTDFESDAECQVTTQKSYIKESQTKGNIECAAPSQEFKQPVAPSRSPVSKNHLQVPETSRWLNNTKNSTIMNNSLDSTRKFNMSTLSVRSHRTTKTKKCCNETCFQEIPTAKKVINNKTTKQETKSTNNSKPESEKSTSKPESKNKTSSEPESKNKTSSKPESKNKTSSKPEIKNKTSSKPEIKNKTSTKQDSNSSKTIQTSVEPSKNTKAKSIKKAANTNKTPTKNTKPKSKTRSADKSRSTSRTRQKSKETKPKQPKKKQNTKNTSVQLSPGRPIRSCRTPSQNRSIENSRSSHQFDITPLNIVGNRLTRKNESCNDSSLQEIISKQEVNRKNPTSKANHDSNEPNKMDKKNTNSAVQSKTSTKKAKPNPNKSMSTLRKSPRKIKSSSKQISKIVLSHQTPKCDRPIRSCRTPGQNRSIENYKSSIRGR